MNTEPSKPQVSIWNAAEREALEILRRKIIDGTFITEYRQYKRYMRINLLKNMCMFLPWWPIAAFFQYAQVMRWELPWYILTLAAVACILAIVQLIRYINRHIDFLVWCALGGIIVFPVIIILYMIFLPMPQETEDLSGSMLSMTISLLMTVHLLWTHKKSLFY